MQHIIYHIRADKITCHKERVMAEQEKEGRKYFI